MSWSGVNEYPTSDDDSLGMFLLITFCILVMFGIPIAAILVTIGNLIF